MKVPNKVIHIVLKLANGTENVTEDERSLVRGWALDGAAKRDAMKAKAFNDALKTMVP